VVLSDEMLSFIRDGRLRTANALKRESHRERQRIFEKMKRSNDMTTFLSFLVDDPSGDRLVVIVMTCF